MSNADLLSGLIFGLFGLIIAFFMSRSINIIIFCGLTYAVFKALEMMNFSTNWRLFNDLLLTLSQFGKTVLTIVNSMITNANITELILFIFGVLLGLLLRERHT